MFFQNRALLYKYLIPPTTVGGIFALFCISIISITVLKSKRKSLKAVFINGGFVKYCNFSSFMLQF